jgi:hypothetical protein
VGSNPTIGYKQKRRKRKGLRRFSFSSNWLKTLLWTLFARASSASGNRMGGIAMLAASSCGTSHHAPPSILSDSFPVAETRDF